MDQSETPNPPPNLTPLVHDVANILYQLLAFYFY